MSLDFIDITYAYAKARAVEDVSFSAGPGEITCLLGPSGCGKSTLLRLAAGILAVQTGEVRLNGELLGGAGQHTPPDRRPIGLVFQDGALFPHMTVAENVGFGLKRRGRRDNSVQYLLAQMDVDGFGSR